MVWAAFNLFIRAILFCNRIDLADVTKRAENLANVNVTFPIETSLNNFEQVGLVLILLKKKCKILFQHFPHFENYGHVLLI
mgnify:CR=1 FL=1